MKLKTVVEQIISESSTYLTDADYKEYLDYAKNALKDVKELKKISTGTTRRGDTYLIIQYIPTLKKGEFEGGDYIRSLQVFYKDNNHLKSIMKDLNLPKTLLN